MASTGTPRTFSELYTDLINRVRVDTGVTAITTQAKRYINIALQDMHIGFNEKFNWAERSATLLTNPQYTTGTVAITQGATALTGTGTLWNTNNAFGVANARVGGKLTIGGTGEVYTVSAVGSDTGITLVERYVGETETAATYLYFEDEYALASDFLRPLDMRRFNGQIDLLGRDRFRELFPRNNTPTTNARVGTIVDRPFSGDTVAVRKIRLAPPPSAATLLPYDYVTSNLAVTSAGVEQQELSGDTDEPIIPYQHRNLLVMHALSKWYRDKKDDSRSQTAAADYTDLLLRLVNDTEIGDKRPRIRPNVSPYARSARRPWSGGRGRRHTAGTAFDEMR